MMHDFAITRRHVVFMDLPVVYDLDLLADRPIPARWEPDHGARLGVLPRNGVGRRRWFDVPLGYVFHTLNAYDDGDRVVLDVVRHPKMFDRDVYGVADGHGQVHRWTIDPARGRVQPGARRRAGPGAAADRPAPGRAALPLRVHAAHRTFARPAVTDCSSAWPSTTCGRAGSRSTGSRRDRRRASRCSSLPAPAKTRGGCSCSSTTAARGASDLVVLDATDFAGGPVARVHLPARVPNGFHGLWVADPVSP